MDEIYRHFPGVEWQVENRNQYLLIEDVFKSVISLTPSRMAQLRSRLIVVPVAESLVHKYLAQFLIMPPALAIFPSQIGNI